MIEDLAKEGRERARRRQALRRPDAVHSGSFNAEIADVTIGLQMKVAMMALVLTGRLHTLVVESAANAACRGTLCNLILDEATMGDPLTHSGGPIQRIRRLTVQYE